MKELYWLCEELVSYTDLTHERFDKENAQRRLFPMKPLLLAIADEKMLDYYQKLDDYLDSTHFDKLAFSECLNELFELIQQKQ